MKLQVIVVACWGLAGCSSAARSMVTHVPSSEPAATATESAPASAPTLSEAAGRYVVVLLHGEDLSAVDPVTGSVHGRWRLPDCRQSSAVIATHHLQSIVVECNGGLGSASTGYAVSARDGSPQLLWQQKTEDVLCADRASNRVLRGLPDTSGFGGGERFAWLDPSTGTETPLPDVPSSSPATAICGEGIAAVASRANGGGIQISTLTDQGRAELLTEPLPSSVVPLLQAFDSSSRKLLFGVLDEQAPSYGIAAISLDDRRPQGLVQFTDALGAAVFTPAGRIVLWNRPPDEHVKFKVAAIDPDEPTVLHRLGADLPEGCRDMMPSDDGSAGLVLAGGSGTPRLYLLDFATDGSRAIALGDAEVRALVRME